MKAYFLSPLFLISYGLIHAQSIGIATGVNYTHINQLDFNKEVNITAYQLTGFKPKLSLMLNFEYPMTSKFRVRTEVSYCSYGYELKQDFGYNSYWANNIGFSNLQGAFLADFTVLQVDKLGYLAVHGGMGFNYAAPARIRMGIYTKKMRNTSSNPPLSESVSMSGTPYNRNHTTNMTLIGGMSIHFLLKKNKLSIGFNYNRALQSSPQLDMKFVLVYNGQPTNYNDSLSPKIHFLNFYISYAWFLKAREKEKKAGK